MLQAECEVYLEQRNSTFLELDREAATLNMNLRLKSRTQQLTENV